MLQNPQRKINPNLQKLQHLLKDEDDGVTNKLNALLTEKNDNVSDKLNHLLKDEEAAKQDQENAMQDPEKIQNAALKNVYKDIPDNRAPASSSAISGLRGSLPTVSQIQPRQELAPGEKVPSATESGKNIYDNESFGYFYVNKIKMDTFLPSRFVNRL
jgi:hypothetical protein